MTTSTTVDGDGNHGDGGGGACSSAQCGYILPATTSCYERTRGATVAPEEAIETISHTTIFIPTTMGAGNAGDGGHQKVAGGGSKNCNSNKDLVSWMRNAIKIECSTCSLRKVSLNTAVLLVAVEK